MNHPSRRALVLLVLGLIAATASLFGPGEPVAGVDVGATGTVLFAGVIIAAIWMFSSRGEDAFPDYMSIAERRAWVGTAFAAILIATFARHVWAMSAHDLPPDTFRDPVARHFVQQAFALWIGWMVIARVMARRAGAVEVDERDLRLAGRAHSAGDFTLTLIVIACVAVLAFAPAAWIAWWLAPIALAYVLIGMLIAKWLVEQAFLALAYRADRQ